MGIDEVLDRKMVTGLVGSGGLGGVRHGSTLRLWEAVGHGKVAIVDSDAGERGRLRIGHRPLPSGTIHGRFVDAELYPPGMSQANALAAREGGPRVSFASPAHFSTSQAIPREHNAESGRMCLPCRAMQK